MSEMCLGLHHAPMQEQRLAQYLDLKAMEPHNPVENPELTLQARKIDEPDLESVARATAFSAEDKMLHAEAALLQRWAFSKEWEKYLDAPLIAHMDAALRLKGQKYDAVVGIKSAGIPYADIFRMAGLPVLSVDYSHYKRNMTVPVMSELSREVLKDKKVLLADIDVVSGKTLTEVHKYLEGVGANVGGAYLGLAVWPGTDVDFSNFWQDNKSGLTWMKRKILNRKGLVPEGLQIYGPNRALDYDETRGGAASRRIAKYLINKNGG